MVFGILGIMLFRLVQVRGAWRLLKLDSEIFMLCCLIIAYFLLISGPVGYAKYRIPFEPVLALLTAFSLGFFDKQHDKKISEDFMKL